MQAIETLNKCIIFESFERDNNSNTLTFWQVKFSIRLLTFIEFSFDLINSVHLLINCGSILTK